MNHKPLIDSRFSAGSNLEAACERTCAKLLIYSPTLTPAAMTQLLGGLQPTSEVLARAPEQGYPGRAHGWFLSSENAVSSKDLRAHLDWLTNTLIPSRLFLKDLQQHEGTRMYVHCPWWGRYNSGGPSLWPEQMRALADLNLECAIDFAYHGAEE